MTLSIITLSITKLSVMTPILTTLYMTTLSMMKIRLTTLSMTTHCIMTIIGSFSITTSRITILNNTQNNF